MKPKHPRHRKVEIDPVAARLREDLARATEVLHASLGPARAEADLLHALGVQPDTLRVWRRKGPPASRSQIISWVLRFAESTEGGHRG